MKMKDQRIMPGRTSNGNDGWCRGTFGLLQWPMEHLQVGWFDYISKADKTELGTRQSRQQFSAHVRMSSCNDEGLSYTCETK
jgi:hypothetical protein